MKVTVGSALTGRSNALWYYAMHHRISTPAIRTDVIDFLQLHLRNRTNISRPLRLIFALWQTPHFFDCPGPFLYLAVAVSGTQNRIPEPAASFNDLILQKRADEAFNGFEKILRSFLSLITEPKNSKI